MYTKRALFAPGITLSDSSGPRTQTRASEGPRVYMRGKQTMFTWIPIYTEFEACRSRNDDGLSAAQMPREARSASVCLIKTLCESKMNDL
jgi:hypothetical protein